MEASNGKEPNLLASPGGSKKSTREVELSRQTCKQKTPVVILINIRSTDTSKTSPQNEHNYLKHFRKIYEEKGWITVQCTPTEDRVEKGEAPEIIKGCILDSCPKQPNGLMDTIREFWPSLHDFLLLIMYLIKTIYPELFGKDLDISEYDKFCYYSGVWSQLYLYSTVDHIVPHKGVEKAISIRSSAGAPIDIKCWNDTEHARHLFIHEQEYTELCQHFVEECTGIV